VTITFWADEDRVRSTVHDIAFDDNSEVLLELNDFSNEKEIHHRPDFTRHLLDVTTVRTGAISPEGRTSDGIRSSFLQPARGGEIQSGSHFLHTLYKHFHGLYQLFRRELP
jgi:hypothetical protein